ncbi:phosphate ABC transporter substrate-binding protein [Hydrogenophilus thermoluteolus]|uniref:phosphate/phosphite/phosphonate ABC transporter substrate-binding protein n=1 Tax=Hydrogenophilus thermoluteolus TaxID=297 RepID=UPI0024A32B28|nr:PhnD/SsuA/transferrin family substrate-binding protein [Hydrogenophilus thermoluteolus]GLW61053.1 phosphate ABC transporter substrate-binding protein [Hydrogenophilus thermoluteolus]
MSASLISRRQTLARLSGLFFGAALARQRARAAAPHLFGVVPYLSARKLAELYEPLRAWFATALAQPVALESAPDYSVHFARTAVGEYDLIATSPYFGRIAQLRHAMVGLARPTTDLEPLLIVLPTSPLQTLTDLKGRTLATSDRWANLTLAARRLLRELGWTIGVDVRLIATGSHANSLAHLRQGLADAAVVSVTTLKQLDLPESGYRILHRLPPTPPLLYLAHARLGEARIAALADAFQQWSRSDGQEHFARLGHGVLRPITDADWQALDGFVAEFDRLNEGGNL